MPRPANLLAHFAAEAQPALRRLQRLILETAAAHPEIGQLEQSLKWGQPSYRSRRGSPIRLGWAASRPTEAALYFHCQLRLVETFREMYGERLCFEGNRAIRLPIADKLPKSDLAHCIYLALTYHDRKHLPMLGACKPNV